MTTNNKKTGGDMQNLVDGYNSMMNDPKEYANTTYKNNIKSQGRAFGKWNGRDTTQKTEKPWPNNNIPV